MMNGINLDMMVTAILFRLAVIVPTTKVEAVAHKADICMEDVVIILYNMINPTLEP
jgi:hypothetical protein